MYLATSFDYNDLLLSTESFFSCGLCGLVISIYKAT